MTRARAAKTKRRPGRKEARELDEFCAKVEYEEISLESWEGCLADLHLRVPLWLTAAEAMLGGERTVSFARSVRQGPSEKPARLATSCVIIVPQGCGAGAEVVVAGQGDILADRSGDLIVTINIRS